MSSVQDIPMAYRYVAQQHNQARPKTQTWQPGGIESPKRSPKKCSTPDLSPKQLSPVEPPGPAYYPRFQQKKDKQSNSMPLPYSPTGSLPSFIKDDRKVLRFYGFFKESVTESNSLTYCEAFRTRKCVILIYLCDNTWQVLEPKVENSGMMQGAFLKRHLIPMPGGGTYSVKDIRCGIDLDIYGKRLRVVDCDAYTRRQLAQSGLKIREIIAHHGAERSKNITRVVLRRIVMAEEVPGHSIYTKAIQEN